MSTEHDETRPLPRPAAHEGPVGDHPTTPIPRAGAGAGGDEDRTEVFSRPQAAPPAGESRPEPTTERIAATTAPSGGLGDLPSPGSRTARISAFAAASPAGTRAGETSGIPEAGGAGSRSAGGSAGGSAAGTATGQVTGSATTTTTSTTTGPTTGPTTDTWPTHAAPPVSTSMRVGTVVWGLVLAIVGAGLIAIAAGAQFDLELALIGLLALAGVALVVGSIVTSARRRR